MEEIKQSGNAYHGKSYLYRIMDLSGILLGLLLIGFGCFLLLPALFYPGLVMVVLGVFILLGGIVTTPSRGARTRRECEDEEQLQAEDEILFMYTTIIDSVRPANLGCVHWESKPGRVLFGENIWARRDSNSRPRLREGEMQLRNWYGGFDLVIHRTEKFSHW